MTPEIWILNIDGEKLSPSAFVIHLPFSTKILQYLDYDGGQHQLTSSSSNNVYAYAIQQRFKQTVVSAKNGGVVEARKRVLAQLPISAQSYTGSPYLGLATPLFYLFC